MTIDDALRASFARHESLTPPAEPLRARIRTAVAARRRRRTRVTVASVAAALVVALAVPAAWAGGLFGDKDRQSTPPAELNGPVNVLVVGADRHPGRSVAFADMVMVAHLPADRRSAYLVSLPRDLRVGDDKLSQVYADGGAAAVTRTVEELTEVRIDLTVEIDFRGLVRVVDALGGVELCVETPPGEDTLTSVHPPYRKFRKGCQKLDGAEALDYVRQRMQYRDGDYARIRHQQQLVRALLTAAQRAGLTKDPRKLVAALQDAIQVDGKVELLALARQTSGLAPADVTGVRAPTRLVEDTTAYLEPEQPAYGELWRAVRDDKLAAWVGKHPDWVNPR